MTQTARLILGLLVVTATGSCAEQGEREPVNPFTDVKPLKIDGRRQALTSLITPLGVFDTDEVIESLVESNQARAAYVLKADEPRTEAGVIEKGVIIDGGPIGEWFFHRVREAGELFLFVDAPTGANVRAAIKRSSEDFRKPPGQTIVLVFEERFLVDALPDSELSDDDEILPQIESFVAQEIFDRLSEIYEGVPVLFAGAEDASSGPLSTITIKSDRKTVSELEASIDPEALLRLDALQVVDEARCALLCTTLFDAVTPDQFGRLCDLLSSELLPGLTLEAVTPLCPDFCTELCREECPNVVFGSVLPIGSGLDPGNRDLNDGAVVFVGSFVTPIRCGGPSFLTNSINNVINTLALNVAHEAGHLVGLNHTALAGLMADEPSLAFQRQLRFQRSQVTFDGGGADLQTLTLVIQDPQIYFDHIFSEQ